MCEEVPDLGRFRWVATEAAIFPFSAMPSVRLRRRSPEVGPNSGPNSRRALARLSESSLQMTVFHLKISEILLLSISRIFPKISHSKIHEELIKIGNLGRKKDVEIVDLVKLFPPSI